MQNLINEVSDKMDKSISALKNAFNKIRTGRANPAILDTGFAFARRKKPLLFIGLQICGPWTCGNIAREASVEIFIILH